MIPLAYRHDLDHVRYLNISRSLCKELDRKDDSLLSITLLLLHAFIIQPAQPGGRKTGVDKYFSVIDRRNGYGYITLTITANCGGFHGQR